VSKKTEKPIKMRKLEEKKTKKTEPWKKPITILKKLTGLIWFRFYKPETEQTEPNPNRKKTRQTEKTELDWLSWARSLRYESMLRILV